MVAISSLTSKLTDRVERVDERVVGWVVVYVEDGIMSSEAANETLFEAFRQKCSQRAASSS
jgi:hypothetical protein